MAAPDTTVAQRPPWAQEVVDVVRALSGGMLFGIPLLYTMETWRAGSTAAPSRLLLVLGITIVPVLILNKTEGFRADPHVTWGEAVKDTVEAVALGIVSVAAVLFLLQEIDLDTPLRDGLGKVVYESTPFSIGIALANHFLRRGRDEGDSDGDEDEDGDTQERGLDATLADVGATTTSAGSGPARWSCGRSTSWAACSPTGSGSRW